MSHSHGTPFETRQLLKVKIADQNLVLFSCRGNRQNTGQGAFTHTALLPHKRCNAHGLVSLVHKQLPEFIFWI